MLRLSAKFNLYFGEPNLSDEVFPAHLAYLKTYFRTRRLNALFPLSIALGAGIVAWGWTAAVAAPVGSGAEVTGTLIAGLAALGVLEHLCLILPLRDVKLWSCGAVELWSWVLSKVDLTKNKAAKTAAIE